MPHPFLNAELENRVGFIFRLPHQNWHTCMTAPLAVLGRLRR